MKLKVITPTSKSNSIEVEAAIFGQKDNPQLLAQAVRVYLSNLRHGNSKVKTRSLVKRTHAKWYRQKGTGNARHGSRNAPIFVGGGVAHGPTGLQNWHKDLNQKMKAQALRVALSLQAENIVVTDNLNNLKGKTSEAAKILKKMLGETKRTVVVLGDNSLLMRRSLANLDRVLVANVNELNALQASLADTIILTKDSLKALEIRLAVKKKTVKKAVVAKPAAVKKPAAKKVSAKKK
jgi:large subunit ribosomal protein L4